MKYVDAISRHSVIVKTSWSSETPNKISNEQQNVGYIKNMKILLKQDVITECILNINIVFRLVNDQDIMLVPKLMQVDTIHSLGRIL